MVKPRANFERRGFNSYPDGRVVEIKLDEMRIASWCPDQAAQLPPEQVHVLLKMNGLEDYTFLMRFKSPDTLGFLIEELARYRKEVWPEAEPVKVE